jgi:hypothetical protein
VLVKGVVLVESTSLRPVCLVIAVAPLWIRFLNSTLISWPDWQTIGLCPLLFKFAFLQVCRRVWQFLLRLLGKSLRGWRCQDIWIHGSTGSLLHVINDDYPTQNELNIISFSKL